MFTLIFFIKRIYRHVWHRYSIGLFNLIGCHQLGITKYDAVICFAEDLAQYAYNFPARKKFIWVHCDYTRVINDANKKTELKYFSKFDKIVCVSDYARLRFVNVLPELIYKTIFIHNIIDEESIIKRSNIKLNDSLYKTDAFTIISAGRLDPIKRFNKIPEIVLKIKGLTTKSFVWYIIGGGFPEEEKKIKAEIVNLHVSNNVIMLGQKDDIAPYLSKSNLYVCTSESESYPMVINEAKALLIPVISTDFPSAFETIVDGRDGFVTTLENIHSVICRFMDSPFKILESNISNNESLKAFDDLMNL